MHSGLDFNPFQNISIIQIFVKGAFIIIWFFLTGVFIFLTTGASAKADSDDTTGVQLGPNSGDLQMYGCIVLLSL